MKHQKGQENEARAMYEALYREGELAASYMLPFAVLLLRSGEEGAFERVKEIMVKAQKAPDMNGAQAAAADELRGSLLENRRTGQRDPAA